MSDTKNTILSLWRSKRKAKSESRKNITKLMTKAGIVPGPSYGKRYKHADNLFNQGKAREAREYLQAEGKKIK